MQENLNTEENQFNLKCQHCGIDCKQQFCCTGCEFIYKMINSSGLEHFYELRDSFIKKDRKVAQPTQVSYQHFDQAEFIQRYVKIDSKGYKNVEFYLEGVHCAGCLWLLEKLPQILQGVVQARLNFERAIIKITFDQVKLSQIASMLDAFGYPAHPLNQQKEIQAKEEKMALLRLGVAGLCAANTMMFAVSLYQGQFTGIESKYALYLRYLSFFVSLPAFLFSAQPFFKGAFQSLKLKQLHIDLPIVFGLLLGFFASSFNTFMGREHIYFDSLTALIFLLLAARWVQTKSVKRALDLSNLLYSITPKFANLYKQGQIQKVLIETLQIGNLVQVKAGEIIPVDGLLKSESANLDLSVLSGESRAVKVSFNQDVYAGSLSIGQQILVEVRKTGQETRIAELLSAAQDQSSKRAPIIEQASKISVYFVSFVLVLAAAVGIYYLPQGLFVALDNILALLVVTCPCALALATPLSFTLASAKAAKRGIYIKGTQVIEALTQVGKVFFDKTGTLTEGKLKVVDSFVIGDQGYIYDLVSQLEINNHPLALALSEHCAEFKDSQKDKLVNINYIVGKGVTAESFDGHSFKIGSLSFHSELKIEASAKDFLNKAFSLQLSPVILAKDKQLLAIFALGDKLRVEAKQIVAELEKSGKEVVILSGDRKEIVLSIAAQLGIKEFYAECSPEEKLKIISSQKLKSAMIGDGVNDAAALRASHVGIGVHGGAQMCLEVADVFICQPGLGPIKELFEGSQRTMSVVRTNFVFSLFYNVIGGSMAILGLVNPLIAALLMPVSSLTVLIFALKSKTFKGD